MAAVERMCEAMAHRGPDEAGSASLDGVTLGMRRLAIFDPANGHQPMQSPDGRFTLVFNGSIINHRDLRAELAGYWAFSTQCDTEALLAAYSRWGEGCLARLRGMFAFAVWDSLERTLFIARDAFGIKPLYYKHDGTRLLFASEIKALLAADSRLGEIDPLAVADFLAWLAVPAPRTIFRGVFSLRPGECARFKGGRLEIRAAWSFSSIGAKTDSRQTQKDFAHELRLRLEETTRAHMLADVPVGAFLSGGLDSAIVVGLMSRMSSQRLSTYTIGFSEPGYSESLEAEATARHYGTNHTTYVLSGSEVAANIGRFLSACDQPTGDGINTYFASRAAKAGGSTVVISGLGGDELFGGYPSFRNIRRLAYWLPRWRLISPNMRKRIVAGMRRGDTRMRKLGDLLSYARDTHELCALQRRVFSEPRRRSLLGDAPLLAIEGETPFHPELALLRSDLGSLDPLELVSAWEMRTYMADVLLRDSDVMSMAHALELRVPFIDRPLVEWLWRQDASHRFNPGRPKEALAASVSDILPPGLLHRTKRGFTFPMATWMRGELKPFLEDTFSDSSINRSGLFERASVQACWHQFLQENDRRNWSRVWSLAMLVAFVNRQTPDSTQVKIPSIFSTPAANARKPAASKAPERAGPAPSRPVTKYEGYTLLMAPEIFSSVGGIPRMLQIYLKALCDIDAPARRAVRLLALNDSQLDSTDVRNYTNGNLDDWFVCKRNKPRFVREALRMARGCDRLICGHLFQLPVAWIAKRLNPRLRYYLVAHGIEIWRRYSLAERVALRGASRILCISEYTRRQLLTNCSLQEGRAVVVPNALDPTFNIAAGAPLADCKPVILTVSRLTYEDRYKGIDHLIAAMPAIRAAEPGASLRIVGQGDDLPRLQALARRAGVLKNGVEFLGFVDDKRMSSEMQNCRVFALPSSKEGFGLVFLEAMAKGRPCLGANAGGIPEVITPDTGVLVEFGDVPGIARGCAHALKHSWNQESIIQHVRRFSYPSFKERLAKLLNQSPAG